MEQFYLHFFKEKVRNIDKEEIVKYLTEEFDFKLEVDDEVVSLLYKHPTLEYEASFHITKKSMVPDIYKISPNFVDVKFHLEIPLLTPNYFFGSILEIVKRLSYRFDLYSYHELFDDVYEYNYERTITVFKMIKNALYEKYPHKLQNYYIISENRLSALLKYLNEQQTLANYYSDLNIHVPGYLYIKDADNNAYLASNWNEGELTVFPPSINYILFKRKDGLIKVIEAKEFYDVNHKLLDEIPGFLQGTKVISKKGYKKILKTAKKGKWEPVTKVFTKYNFSQLIDL